MIFESPSGGQGVLYYIYSVLNVIKRDIRHNAMAQVKYKPVFPFHPVEQAVDTFFDNSFIGI